MYNYGDEELDISGWTIAPLSNPDNELVIDLDDFPPGRFCVINADWGWIDPAS